MNKLTLNEIVGYIPYRLEVRHEGIIIEVHGIIHNDIYNSDTGEIPLHSIKPILNRIEDMSKEQLNELEPIRRYKCSSDIDFIIKGSAFYYKHKFDIHNLIDRGLAVDSKTLNTHTNVK